MSLDDFDTAIAREGYRYELSRGVIVVAEIPGLPHLHVLDRLRMQIDNAVTPLRPKGVMVAAAMHCKLLIADYESERHPDLAVYFGDPGESENPWSTWIPALVVEIVAADTEDCDYHLKPEEYLALGVQEYWIVDPAKGEVLVRQRWRSQWRERIIRPPQRYSSQMLPDFEFDCEGFFAAEPS